MLQLLADITIRKKANEYFTTYHNRINQLLDNKELTDREKNIISKIQELYEKLN